MEGKFFLIKSKNTFLKLHICLFVFVRVRVFFYYIVCVRSYFLKTVCSPLTKTPNILRHTYTWKVKVKLNTSTMRLVTQYLLLKLLYRNIPIPDINFSTNSKNVQFVAKYFGMDPKIWTQRSWQDNIQWEV